MLAKKSPELGLLLYHHLDGQSCLSRNKFLREGRTQTNWKVLHFMCSERRRRTTKRSPTQRFLPRSLVFYSKALQFLRVLCITTFCRLLDSFLSQPSNIDKVKWIKKSSSSSKVPKLCYLSFGWPEEVKQSAKGRAVMMRENKAQDSDAVVMSKDLKFFFSNHFCLWPYPLWLPPLLLPFQATAFSHLLDFVVIVSSGK